MVGDAQRYVRIREKANDPWRIPTGMAKLEAVAPLGRQHAEEGRKAVCVSLKVRWQLKENRSYLVSDTKLLPV
jgi:hypothetical protein